MTTETDRSRAPRRDSERALFVPVEDDLRHLADASDQIAVSEDRGPATEQATISEAWMPTEFSRGPWSPDALHGGPVAALIVRAAERVPAPIPTRLARVTVELLRPVPFEPLLVETRVLRPGKKVATLEVTLRSAAAESVDEPRHGSAPSGAETVSSSVYAIARVQRIRTDSIEFPDGVSDEVPSFPEAASTIAPWPGAADVTFHANAVEHRFLHGNFSEQGPSFDWMRLVVPVVPGEDPTGWQRAAACADFTNGISSVAPFDGKSTFINPDLTVHLWREPEGEWVGSDAVTRTSSTGIGLAQTSLWDLRGRCGSGLQSLYLDR